MRGGLPLQRASWTVVATLTVCFIFLAPQAESRSSYALRLAEVHGCQPNGVPEEERCAYVRSHACRPNDAWIPYLELHYCYLLPLSSHGAVASTALFLLWIAVLFAIMLMVAERFFCPSLELVSEYLRLPPCVAGATLLSFGNGAPDVFTQLAAIRQGESGDSSIAMALSEPLGSGLFVGNIVFALVVFFSGLREVRVQRWYFLKDCLFYLVGVLIVLGFLMHGVVTLWGVALLAAFYVAFMAATILLSRGDEPVHADPRLHEVPHRLRPADSFMRESLSRNFGSESGAALDADLTAPLLPLPDGNAVAPRKSNPGLQPIDEALCLPEDCAAAPPGGPETESSCWKLDLDLQDLVLDPEEVRRKRQLPLRPAEPAPVVLVLRDSPGTGGETAVSSAGSGCGGGGGGDREGGSSVAAYVAPAAPPSPPLVTAYGASSIGRTLSGGCIGGRAGGGGRGDRTLSWDCATSGGATLVGSPGCPARRGGFERVPSLRRSESGGPPGPMQRLWRRLEKPGLVLLSLFMPRVAIDTHARYRKSCAVLLPPLLPTLVGWSQGWVDLRGPFWRQTGWLGATGVGLAVAAAAAVWYPRKGHLHGYAAGIATVVVFCEAMVLLDGCAGELVGAAVALGQIYCISPSLLGATLLAWGNSVSDLVSNITLAKDGLPSMAITACFASPLFALLAGLVASLTYGTLHGPLQLPSDLSLRVLYGCSAAILLMWALVVPLGFRFRLTRRVGVLAVAVYAAFQAIYISIIVHETRRR